MIGNPYLKVISRCARAGNEMLAGFLEDEENIFSFESNAVCLEFFQGFTSYIMVHVSGSDSACKALAPGLQAFIGRHIEVLKRLSLNDSNGPGQDTVADFLVECLRCCNFALHNSTVVRTFLYYIEQCAIAIEGEPERCRDMATFGALGYNSTSHKIIMHV